MSYDQTFKGRFTYADAHCLEAAIDAFLDRDPDDDEASVLELDDLKIDGLSISIDWDGSAPAASSFGSEASLRALAEHALSGTMKTSFTMDTTERTTVSARKRRSAAGLPPRHHRWEIYAAAKAGDAKRLRALKARLDVRYPEVYDYSPLHLAARSGSGDAVDVVLAAGVPADVLAKGRAPLHHASSAMVIARLLRAGADKDRVDAHGATPLLHAIENENFDAARALFDAGATLGKAKKRKGEAPPAVRACAALAEAKQLELLRAMFQRGDLATALDSPDVMTRAIAGGDQVVIDFLLQHGAVLPKDFLKQAIESESITLVELALRDRRALKRAGQSNQREDPMVLAVYTGNLGIVRLVADAGFPIAATQPGPFSPLHMASGNQEIIEFLLERGAPIDAVDDDGMTALAMAIWMADLETAKLLYRAGASIDAVNRKTVTDAEMTAFWKAAGKPKPKKKRK